MLLNAIRVAVLLALESAMGTIAQSFNVTTPIFWQVSNGGLTAVSCNLALLSILFQNTTIKTPVTAHIKTSENVFQSIFDNLVNQTSNSVEFKGQYLINTIGKTLTIGSR